MKRSTKLVLLAGCALVLALEGPLTLRMLAAGWRGPYAPRSSAPRIAAARETMPALSLERLELARR